MVHYKRTQSRWAVKAPAETDNMYDSEPKKRGICRMDSEETDLSETGNFSSNSSGDESWSDNSPSSSKTKLKCEAGLFVPKQPMHGSGEQRTKLSSGASVFVPGQMVSQQVPPTFSAQMPHAPNMFVPQMMPMDHAMPYMAAYCYMPSDGCYYMVPDASTGIGCPVAMPVIPGASPPCVPFEAPLAKESGARPAMERAKEHVKPSTIKDPQFTGKEAASPTGKSRWADLDDDDYEEDNPWLQ